jgi:hypothetical protein
MRSSNKETVPAWLTTSQYNLNEVPTKMLGNLSLFWGLIG